MFATKVEGTSALVSVEALAITRIGIKKRIRRERNRYRLSDDGEYKLKRLDNIRRLEIIAKEIKDLEEML